MGSRHFYSLPSRNQFYITIHSTILHKQAKPAFCITYFQPVSYLVSVTSFHGRTAASYCNTTSKWRVVAMLGTPGRATDTTCICSPLLPHRYTIWSFTWHTEGKQLTAPMLCCIPTKLQLETNLTEVFMVHHCLKMPHRSVKRSTVMGCPLGAKEPWMCYDAAHADGFGSQAVGRLGQAK